VLTKINKMKGRKGFTLVELLLVVAILAVLAFLAVPAIAETIRNSRMRTCASNEKMIEDALWRYYADGIAKGLTLDPTYTGEAGLAVADVEATFTWTSSTWDDFTPYFTPGGVPKCPFGGTDTYLIEIVCSDAGLDDVLVICDDSVDGTGDHPRSADRRTEIATTP